MPGGKDGTPSIDGTCSMVMSEDEARADNGARLRAKAIASMAVANGLTSSAYCITKTKKSGAVMSKVEPELLTMTYSTADKAPTQRIDPVLSENFVLGEIRLPPKQQDFCLQCRS